MALEVKRQGRETSQGLVRRFGQRVQRSGIIVKVRRSRFKLRKKSDGAKKRQALRREELKIEYRHMDKMGTLPTRSRRY